MSAETKWYVRDFRASKMREMGWTGPSIDRILIVNKSGAEIVESAGDDCVVARIQFDNRPEELTDGALRDAHLIAASPALYEALEKLRTAYAVAHIAMGVDPAESQSLNEADRALSLARGERDVG